MSAPIQGRWKAPGRLRAGAGALGLGLLLALAAGQAFAQQANFAPLERGDYSEVEERLIVARGLQVGVDYALRVRQNNGGRLPPELLDTDVGHDLRLRLDTVFHRDVRLHLTLELVNEGYSDTNLRQAPRDTRGRLDDGIVTTLNAREAYLRYNFNPNSGLILGKQELSLGDRRGKTFHALVPAFTFDCKVGTWCMPFGVAVVGPATSDAITHWALQYTAWDDRVDARRDTLQVEVFRLRYDEGNIPLGRNLGPARFNPDAPRGTVSGGTPDPSQLLQQDGDPIYYDADSQDFYGFRVNWEGGSLFVNFDVVGYRGFRTYHLYDDPVLGLEGDLAVAQAQREIQRSKGTALESELGIRWVTGRVGFRIMSATGDSYIADSNGQQYRRGVTGYYEITPGSYAGARAWFNGGDANVELGGGLGHSINNTRLYGFYLDYADPDKRKLGYALGLYQLSHKYPVPNVNGELRDDIGIELDNLLTWFVHEALKFQVEANGIAAGGAFRHNDFDLPAAKPKNFYQFIGRVVYSF